MKIAIDIRALGGSQYGGVAEYINNLLPALFALPTSHHFHLFANSYKKNQDYSHLAHYPNVTLHEFHYPNKALTLSCRYLGRPRCDDILGGVDVFFSPHFLPAPVSAHCKKVTTFHDLSFEYFPEFFDLKRRIWHTYISPRAQARTSDAMIAVSQSTKDDLVRLYGVPSDAVSVIHSGLDTNLFDSAQHGFNAVKRTYKLPEHYILSFSTLEPRKNFIELIRAFNVLKEDSAFADIKLVIAGAYGWSATSITKEAQRSPYHNEILFIGTIKQEDKPHIYNHARVFIYPSLYEGFGFPPLEAMYCGVPTLVSAITSLPEIVGGSALLIDPYRPRELARVVAEVLRDEKLAATLSHEGREHARRFNWHKTAQDTLRVLEGV